MATIELTKENFTSYSALEDLVGRARALDMDDVRRKRAARRKTS